ncbi:PadR family transcriptional regulator [bacterium]|nr:PadR family transcriptional regulator [bacterium]
MNNKKELGESDRITRFESRLKQGFLRLVVLHLLKQEKAKNGYDLMRKIKNDTNSRWTPGANRIYPILKELEEAGWLVSSENNQGSRKRKSIVMTEAGKEAAEKLIQITQEVLEPWLELIVNMKDLNNSKKAGT